MSTNHTAAGVVLALVLSACGSHGSATPSDAPSVPASGSSPSRTADACAAGEAEASDEVALLYFPCGSTGVMAAVERSVTETGDERVAQVLQLYLAGPSAEEREAGSSSMLGPGDIDIVEISPRRLVLNFPSAVDNVSTSAGSRSVLGGLRKTFVGLNGIEEIELRLRNDCAAFFEWIQVGPTCHVLTADGLARAADAALRLVHRFYVSIRQLDRAGLLATLALEQGSHDPEIAEAHALALARGGRAADLDAALAVCDAVLEHHGGSTEDGWRSLAVRAAALGGQRRRLNVPYTDELDADGNLVPVAVITRRSQGALALPASFGRRETDGAAIPPVGIQERAVARSSRSSP